VIHNLELFMAYDPRIDNAGSDGELADFDNERVRQIVAATQNYINRGSYPRLVVMHERDGSEPKAAVGRFTRIAYEERDGIGYIVGDCEVPKTVFDAMIRNNAFPRRSAEIYKDLNHLAAVALLGREAPRRPLPDTNFAQDADPAMFSRKFNANFAGVGGGTNTFVPAELTENNMPNKDMASMMEQMCSGIEEIKKMCRTFAEAKSPDKPDAEMSDEAPEEMAGPGMEYSEEGEDKTDMGDLTITHDEEPSGKPMSRRMSRNSRDSAVETLAAENTRLKAKFARFERELRVERFTRAVEDLRQDGYNIRDEQVPGLVQQLERSDDPVSLIESWRDLFSRDPIGRRIDMSRAALPAGDIGMDDVSRLVREHAGKPESFAAAVNARLGARR
jgi:hypothetical protein